MKKLVKATAVAMAVCMGILPLSGCGGGTDSSQVSSTGTQTSSDGTLDTSKYVEMNFMLHGVEEPDDMELVAEEINKLTMRDFNMKVNWIFTGLDNDKYNLKLTSGEQIDLCYTASWRNYGVNAKGGAFLDLTDLIPTYAPESWEKMDQQKWEEAKVDGRIYCVPNDETSYRYNGLLYRADLAEQFGIETPIQTWEDMGKYLEECKKAYPDILPITEDPTILANTLREMNSEKAETIAGANIYYAASKTNDTYEIYNLYASEGFREGVTIAQDWYNKGYWSKSILSNQTSGMPMFTEGLAFACKGNIPSARSIGAEWQITHPDWEVDIFTSAELKGIAHLNPSVNNAIALPTTCVDPARALAFLDKLRYDREYFDLTIYGIEGKHYQINEEGQIEFLGADGARLFDMGSVGTGWYVEDMAYPQPNEWDNYEQLCARLDPLVQPRKCDNFAFDPSAVSAQQAALNQVVEQYAVPMLLGMSTDIDAEIANLNEQLEKAGMKEYQQELERQTKQYWEEMGY